MRITNSLVNIRAITSHFQPRIDSWLAKEQLSTPTEDQILDVVRDNYDSLTLKLQEGLDQYDNYAENPTYTSFFTSLVRSIVSDTRQVQIRIVHLLKCYFTTNIFRKLFLMISTYKMSYRTFLPFSRDEVALLAWCSDFSVIFSVL